MWAQCNSPCQVPRSLFRRAAWWAGRKFLRTFTCAAAGRLTKDDAPGEAFTDFARVGIPNGYFVTATSALGAVGKVQVERALDLHAGKVDVETPRLDFPPVFTPALWVRLHPGEARTAAPRLRCPPRRAR